MTCQECTELLLEETDAGELNRAAVLHLSECEDCHGLAGELRANAVALRSMREDVVPSKPVVLGPNVLPMRVAEKHPRQLYWLAAAAALVVAVGLGAMRMNRSSVPNVGTREVMQHVAAVERPEVAEALPIPSQSLPPSMRTAARRQAERRGERNRKSNTTIAVVSRPRVAAVPTQPMKIQLLTSDPNIVIYWLVGDTKSESAYEGDIL